MATAMATGPAMAAADAESLPHPPPAGVMAAVAREAREVELQRLENARRAGAALCQALGPEAKLAKLATVDDRTIVAVDDLVPLDLLEHFYSCLQGDAFRRTEFARPDTREFRHHLTEYNPETFRRTQIFDIVDRVVQMCFPQAEGPPLQLYRVYTNAVLYGDVAFAHRDSGVNSHVTVLLYPNPEWSPELGGETFFYDEGGEIAAAVAPHPGRICCFNGSIMHKGSPPSRLFFGTRYTTAFKFSPPDDDDAAWPEEAGRGGREHGEDGPGASSAAAAARRSGGPPPPESFGGSW